jgi:Cof subfamily protein (haloacid dehalogenase superfamily)
MARYSILATDLDGTLLNDDGRISGRNRAAIRAAQDAGMTVAFVTARPPRDMAALAREAGLTGIAVCSNGAILYDIGADAVLTHERLDGPLARQLIAELRAALPKVAFATEHGHKIGQEPHFPRLFEATVHYQPMRIDCALLLCEEDTTKLIAHHPGQSADELAAAIEAVVGARAAVTHSGWPIVEVGALGVSKASGLKALCERLGLGGEAVIAFGDMPNDLPMLRFAGHGVAVANAHPLVLAAADHITASNAEDGVAQVIEALLAEAG